MPLTFASGKKKKQEAKVISIRLSGKDLELVRSAAEQSDMTPGAWLKATAIYTAGLIEKVVANAPEN